MTIAEEFAKPQNRAYETRAEAGEEGQRTVAGIAVPFNEPITIRGWFDSWQEQFTEETVFEGAERALLAWRHGEVIGKLTRHESRAGSGLEIEARIAATRLGDEAYTLAREGVVDRFSVGFQPLEWREDADGLVTYTRVRLLEVSLVPWPAYDGAELTEVRHRTTDKETPDMTPDTLTRSDLDRELEQLRADLTREHSAELARALEQQRGGTARLGSQWRSAGEFLKALARGDDDALEFHRAFTGGTTADTAQPATWIDDKIKFVEERRREINSFTRETLPPEGMTLEYLRLKSNSITVGKQINQGESAGLGFGKVELDSATAAIETAGGWTTFSRQAIERASATYLNTGLKALDLAYARYTEATFKAVLAAAVTAQVTANNDLELVATPDVYDWRDLIIDAAERFEENGFVLAGLKVSSDVFKRMQRIELPSGDPAFTVSGERVNREGELNLPGIEGEFARVKVEVVRGAAANFATFWDPVAVTFWESAGAPLMLQDESIINLSKDFSEYGYIAAASQFPTALVPLTFAA